MLSNPILLAAEISRGTVIYYNKQKSFSYKNMWETKLEQNIQDCTG